MSLPDLVYHRPASLAAACELSRRLLSDAAFIAGGTELLPDLQRQREPARHMIALDGIGELRGLTEVDGAICIGALTTIATLASSPLVRDRLPALHEAARALGSPSIRSLATIGGNFCRAVPCADTPPPAIACDARLRLFGANGTREIAAEDFFIGPRQTALAAGELLLEVVIPRQPAGGGASYERFARRRGAALAIASVASRIVLTAGRITSARIVLGAVAPVPLLVPAAAALLEGEDPTLELFARAAAACVDAALPITDIRGTAAFRRDLVHVLARRSLIDATARARRAAGAAR